MLDGGSAQTVASLLMLMFLCSHRRSILILTASIVCIVLFQISAFVHERRERDDGSGFASEYARAHRAYVKPYLASHIGLIRLKAALGACYQRRRAELLGSLEHCAKALSLAGLVQEEGILLPLCGIQRFNKAVDPSDLGNYTAAGLLCRLFAYSVPALELLATPSVRCTTRSERKKHISFAPDSTHFWMI